MMKTGSATAMSHGQPNTRTAITPSNETANQQLDHTISHDSAYKRREVGCSMARMRTNKTHHQRPRPRARVAASWTN